jgi:hypothetical protein
MTHEKIFSRPDGTKHKVIVSFYAGFIEKDCKWSVEVLKCEPRKRTWLNVTSDDYQWRAKSMGDRAKADMDKFLKLVTPEEILQAKVELWEKMKPTL